jgi:hypothetical protein
MSWQAGSGPSGQDGKERSHNDDDPQPKTATRKNSTLTIVIVILVILLAANLVLVYFNYSVYKSVKNFHDSSTLTAISPLTATCTETLLASPTITVTPTPSATPFMVQTSTIGYSVGGRPIDSTCLGSGDRIAVLVAGMHGDEANPRYMLADIQEAFQADPSLLPAGVTICFIANQNPDGAAANTRFNAHGVDLNRNWDTDDWVADIVRGNGTLLGGGGIYPLSEPENSSLADYLLELQSRTTEKVIVLSLHSTVSTFSDVRPGYTVVNGQIQWGPLSSAVAQRYADLLGYTYLYQYAYPITGEALHWMADHGFVSLGIEMPDEGYYDDTLLQKHLTAIRDVLSNWPQ